MTKLYLDLVKAISSTPNVSTTTESETKTSRSYDSSFSKRPVGVSGGGETQKPDKKEVGKQWKGSGETVSDELEEDQESRNKAAQDAGVVPKDNTKKSLGEATDLLKSFNANLGMRNRLSRPNPAEVEYLLCKGFSVEDIEQGRAIISGRDRHDFSQWLLARIPKNATDIFRS